MRIINLVCDEHTIVQIPPAGTVVFVPGEAIPVIESRWADCRKAGAYPESGPWPKSTIAEQPAPVPFDPTDGKLDDEVDDPEEVVLQQNELEAIVISRLKDAVAMVYEMNDPSRLRENGVPRVSAIRELVSDDFTADQLAEATVQYHQSKLAG